MELDGGKARRQRLRIALLAIAFSNVVGIIYSSDRQCEIFCNVEVLAAVDDECCVFLQGFPFADVIF